jgi:hypothetical protein
VYRSKNIKYVKPFIVQIQNPEKVHQNRLCDSLLVTASNQQHRTWWRVVENIVIWRDSGLHINYGEINVYASIGSDLFFRHEAIHVHGHNLQAYLQAARFSASE